MVVLRVRKRALVHVDVCDSFRLAPRRSLLRAPPVNVRVVSLVPHIRVTVDDQLGIASLARDEVKDGVGLTFDFGASPPRMSLLIVVVVLMVIFMIVVGIVVEIIKH